MNNDENITTLKWIKEDTKTGWLPGFEEINSSENISYQTEWVEYNEQEIVANY